MIKDRVPNPPPNDQLIHAPWADDQVTVINRFQREANIHPFTCGKCSPHATLVATVDGWICPNFCGYHQDWAPAYMADAVMLERMIGVADER